MTTRTFLAPLLLVGLLVVGEPYTAPTPSPTPFTMRVVDAQTGRGVPGLRLTSDNGVVCYTTRNGETRWGERSLLGRIVHFDARTLTREATSSRNGERIRAAARSTVVSRLSYSRSNGENRNTPIRATRKEATTRSQKRPLRPRSRGRGGG